MDLEESAIRLAQEITILSYLKELTPPPSAKERKSAVEYIDARLKTPPSPSLITEKEKELEGIKAAIAVTSSQRVLPGLIAERDRLVKELEEAKPAKKSNTSKDVLALQTLRLALRSEQEEKASKVEERVKQ